MALVGTSTSCTANTTTAITLPGTAGVADADMEIQVFAHTDIAVERSADGGTTWSSNVGGTPSVGTPIYVASGDAVRFRNSNAVTARVADWTYRYLGTPR